MDLWKLVESTYEEPSEEAMSETWSDAKQNLYKGECL